MAKERNSIKPPKQRKWRRNLTLNLRAALEPLGMGDLVTSGNFLKNAPLYGFIIMLGCLYIWNTVISDKSKRSIEILTVELEDLRYKDLEIQREVNRETELATLERKAKARGLKWSKQVPKVIHVEN